MNVTLKQENNNVIERLSTTLNKDAVLNVLKQFKAYHLVFWHIGEDNVEVTIHGNNVTDIIESIVLFKEMLQKEEKWVEKNIEPLTTGLETEFRCPRCRTMLRMIPNHNEELEDEKSFYHLECPKCSWKSFKVCDTKNGAIKHFRLINNISDSVPDERRTIVSLDVNELKEIYDSEDTTANNKLVDRLVKEIDENKNRNQKNEEIQVKVKGCPICGRQPTFERYTHKDMSDLNKKIYVTILYCIHETHEVFAKGIGKTREEADEKAIDKWNTRYIPCGETGEAKQRCVDVQSVSNVMDVPNSHKNESAKCGWLSPHGELLDFKASVIVKKYYSKFNIHMDGDERPQSFLLRKGWISISDALGGLKEDTLSIFWIKPLTDEQKFILKSYFESETINIDRWSVVHWENEIEE